VGAVFETTKANLRKILKSLDIFAFLCYYECVERRFIALWHKEASTMSKREDIIRKAAESEGMNYPLDDKTMEFSESVLRSLDSGVAWANGKKHNLIKVDIKEWLKEKQRMADEA
jgi:hypothetical protein